MGNEHSNVARHHEYMHMCVISMCNLYLIPLRSHKGGRQHYLCSTSEKTWAQTDSLLQVKSLGSY